MPAFIVKPKRLSAICLAVLVGQVCCVAGRGGLADASSADAVKPDVDSVDLIVVLLHSGWILDVHPDGSGRLQYGSGPTDGAVFAAGSIDFGKMFVQLPQYGEATGEKGAVAVSIRRKSDAKSISRSLPSQVAETLCVQAAERAKAPDATHLDELIKLHPFAEP